MRFSRIYQKNSCDRHSWDDFSQKAELQEKAANNSKASVFSALSRASTPKRVAFLLLCVILFSAVILPGKIAKSHSNIPTNGNIYVAKSRQNTTILRQNDAKQCNLTLSAKSAFVLELTSGEEVFSKNENERLPMASTTKIMTALVVITRCDLTERVKIPREACGIEGSSIYLRDGEEFTVEELLYALMLASANDAAVALAIHTAGSVEGFVTLMNEQASELGLTDTHFCDPHGLSASGHYTTARELALIALEAMKHDEFSRICSTKSTVIRSDSKESARLLRNHNRMLTLYTGAFGIKTGYIKASGRCLVSGAERNGISFIAVTLDASDDWNDHRLMLDYAFSLYRGIHILSRGELSLSLMLCGSLQSSVLCTNADDIYIIVPKELSDDEISTVIEMREFEFAPIESGRSVGRVAVIYKGEVIAQSDIVTLYCAKEC